MIFFPSTAAAAAARRLEREKQQNKPETKPRWTHLILCFFCLARRRNPIWLLIRFFFRVFVNPFGRIHVNKNSFNSRLMSSTSAQSNIEFSAWDAREGRNYYALITPRVFYQFCAHFPVDLNISGDKFISLVLWENKFLFIISRLRLAPSILIPLPAFFFRAARPSKCLVMMTMMFIRTSCTSIEKTGFRIG